MRKLMLVLIVLYFGFTPFAKAQSVVVLDTNFSAFKNVYLNTLGRAQLQLSTTSYNTQTDSVYFSQQVFSCADRNDSVMVTVRITDTAASPAVTYFSDSLRIWTIDTTAPFILIADTATVYLKANGTAKLFFTDFDNGSWDSCGVSKAGFQILTLTDFFCADIGTKRIRISVPDFSGNISTDSLYVTIVDTLPPTLSVKSVDTVYVTGSPLTASLSFANINLGSSDNCGLGAATLNGQQSLTLTCADLGLNKIHVQLADQYGNVSRDTIDLYVLDTTGYTYTVNQSTAYLQGDSIAIATAGLVTVSSAACVVPTVTFLGDTVFTCAAVQSSPVYLQFSIASGGSLLLDSVPITILDTVAPVLVLQSDTFYTASNLYTINFGDIDGGSTDNCGIDSLLLNGGIQASFACADTGWQKIVVHAYDVSGNLSTDSVAVYLIDTVQPAYATQAVTAYLQSDTVRISRANIFSSFQTGCSGAQLTFLSDTAFACASAGTNPNYVVFAISYGGTSITDSVPVTVLDTLNPALSLRSDTVYLSGNPLQASITFAAIDNGTQDNCGIDSLTINGQDTLQFTCADVGSQSIVVYAADASGNAALDSVTLWVLDTIAPVYTKVPQTVYLQTDSVAVPTSQLLTGLAAGCNPPQVTWLGDTVFTCADALTSPRYIPFSISAAGITRTDSIAVVVLDTVKPTIVVAQQDTAVIFGTSLTIDFTDLDQGSFDNCSIDSVTINGANQLNFTCSDLGLQNVVVAVWDVFGNTASDTIHLMVVDTVSPSYTKTPFTAYLNDSTVAVSRANILSNIGAGCSSASGSVSLLSDTVFSCANLTSNPNWIHFSATAGGITVFDSVSVTVVDTVKPVFTTKPPQTIYLNTTGNYPLTVSDLLQAAPTDNCGIDSILITPPVLTCSNSGSFTPVAIQIWDNSGNNRTKFMFAIAVDTLKPTLMLQSATVVLDSLTGAYTLTANDIIQQVGDNCALTNVSIVPNQFSCSDTGLVSVTVTASDANGNTTAKSTSVYVVDATAPTVQTLNNYQLYLNANGNAQVALGDLLTAQPFDACGIVDTVLSKSIFSCADVGTNSISIAMSDAGGNITANTVFVSVVDTTRPTGVFKPVVLSLDTSGVAILTLNDILVSSSDNCGVNLPATVLSKSVFGCADIGFQNITVTLYDVHGNFRVYSRIIEIEGSNAQGAEISGPTEVCQNQYNVKYRVDSVATYNSYDWKLPVGCVEISRSFKGREIYVHWLPGYSGGTLRLIERNSTCKIDSAELAVTASGLAPDTATISYWNEQTKTTLVIADNSAAYYQWGFDQWVNGQRVSTPITGATKSSYYDTSIASNIANLGYQYWCETSLDGVCYNRSYFMAYPIQIVEEHVSGLEIWPNPYKHTLTITASQAITDVEMFDLLGRSVFSAHYAKTETTVHCDAALPSSTYILLVTLKDGTRLNHKIIKTQ